LWADIRFFIPAYLKNVLKAFEHQDFLFDISKKHKIYEKFVKNVEK